MFGSHLSVAGGMTNALAEAKRLKLDCVQVFTKNQRQWTSKPLDPAERDAWLARLGELDWDAAADPAAPVRVVSHNSYLVNLASPASDLWKKSLACQRIELERCEELRIPLCVMHPGAHLGQPRPGGAKSPNRLDGTFSADEQAGLLRIVKALDRLHQDLPGHRTITCLETTVGSGTNLGYSFEQLAFIRSNIREPDRVAYCFDTCHVTAAGYDMSSDAAAQATLERWDAVCGENLARVFHFNDSKGVLGSRLDRHAHIGQGTCGDACFRTILNRPAWRTVPKILETPKETDAKGVEWDIVNVKRLRKLMGPPPGQGSKQGKTRGTSRGKKG